MLENTNEVPASIRRLDSADATRLATLVEAYDDLQTVLRCCERLLTILSRDDRDEVDIEAIWTLALLSYARSFADHDGAPAITEDDLDQSAGGDDVVRWHRVLLHLRDRHADPSSNPRETYTVGLAQDPAGAVNAVAVTSVRSPLVDEAAVRQAGAMAFPLCAVLDERIDPLQRSILAGARDAPKTELDAMDLIEVAATG
jgi:hypothetical protein